MPQEKTTNLKLRAQVLKHIREWFEKRLFIEVETPILVNCPDLSPNLNILQTEIRTNSVETHGNASLQQTQKKYLITSPEFSMKKLLSMPGMDDIFTLTKVFRDGEEDTGIHSIEFTMLEWYRKGADYNDIMKDTEDLINSLKALPLLQKRSKGDFSTALHNQSELTLGRSYATTECASASKSIFLPVPTSEKSPLTPLYKRGEQQFPLLTKEGLGVVFPRLKISNLFKKYAKIDKVEELTLPVFTKIVHSRGYSKDKNLNYEQCFNLIFLNEIEPRLPKTPFFLIDYPAPLACLAKLKKNNPPIAERFELYINGMELCNGFSELTDGKEQLARFKEENRERRRLGKDELPIDYDLCEKLNLIGKAGGNALGIDRLVMILLGAKKIDEVLSFPY